MVFIRQKTYNRDLFKIIYSEVSSLKRPKQNKIISSDVTGQGRIKKKVHESPLSGNKDYTIGLADIKIIK